MSELILGEIVFLLNHTFYEIKPLLHLHNPQQLFLIPQEKIYFLQTMNDIYMLLFLIEYHQICNHYQDKYRRQLVNKPIKVGMNVEEVKVRKHEVDIPGLQKCILSHYQNSTKDKRQIVQELNDKYSTVEHYFRKLGSKFFSIPSEDHWPQL